MEEVKKTFGEVIRALQTYRAIDYAARKWSDESFLQTDSTGKTILAGLEGFRRDILVNYLCSRQRFDLVTKLHTLRDTDGYCFYDLFFAGRLQGQRTFFYILTDSAHRRSFRQEWLHPDIRPIFAVKMVKFYTEYLGRENDTWKCVCILDWFPELINYVNEAGESAISLAVSGNTKFIASINKSISLVEPWVHFTKLDNFTFRDTGVNAAWQIAELLANPQIVAPGTRKDLLRLMESEDEHMEYRVNKLVEERLDGCAADLFALIIFHSDGFYTFRPVE